MCIRDRNNDGSPSLVQAIEFSVNKWSKTERFEWALQWENVGDGSAQEGIAPTWRIWTGIGWQDTGVTQRLAGDKWHSLRLRGNITNGKVHYVSFRSDGHSHNLGQSFDTVKTPGDDRLTVAFQLDGNYQQQQYDCLFDHVGAQWWDNVANPW